MTTLKKLKAYRCLKGAKQKDIARLIGGIIKYV